MMILQHNNAWKLLNQFLGREVMAHAEKCPVCDKDGEVERELPNGEIVSIKCHGCNGLGWVTVYDGNEVIPDMFTPQIFGISSTLRFTNPSDITTLFGDTDVSTTSTAIANFTIDTDNAGNTSWRGTTDAGDLIGINFSSTIAGNTAGDSTTYRFNFSDKDKEKFK